jgi:hypothetical protein
MNNRIIRTARRIARLGGFGSAPYIVYGTGQYARGPYNGTAAGRLEAARCFYRAPAPDGATLYVGDTEVARC